MAATIKDIARELCISTSTVSYALNGGPRKVPDEVRRLVLAKAQEMDYRPNRIAKSLVTGRANAIGIVPPATHADIFRSPFVQVAFNALVNEAEEMGQDLFLFTARDRDRMDNAGRDLMDARIDGVIFIAPSVAATAISELRDRRFPYAVIAGAIHGAECSFAADNEAGVREAVKHLFDLGHRRIAHISGTVDHDDSIKRRNAFVEQVTEIGLDPDPALIIPAEFTQIAGYRAAMEFLQLPNRPTAIVASNDEIAFGVTMAFRDAGVRIPDDVSLIGFDDSAFCGTLSPRLTSVRQPVDAMAVEAVRFLMRRLEGEDVEQGRLFSTELIVRESTAPPRKSSD